MYRHYWNKRLNACRAQYGRLRHDKSELVKRELHDCKLSRSIGQVCYNCNLQSISLCDVYCSLDGFIYSSTVDVAGRNAAETRVSRRRDYCLVGIRGNFAFAAPVAQYIAVFNTCRSNM